MPTKLRLRAPLAATLLAATSLAFAAAPAFARTNHAVVVAVSDYPVLGATATLKGPKNDAALVRDYLTSASPVKFDASNVAVLADGVAGATGLPTHAAILAALKKVADDSAKGDFVYLHFSGHGAQQPALKPGTEPDGLDEIFLPADTGMWVDTTKGVPNALVDDEIAEALDAIRDKGAFVWVVFDSCHSATSTREASSRRVDPSVLGIPASAIEAAEAAARGNPSDQREAPLSVSEQDSRAVALAGGKPDAAARGGMVAFFAAQTIQTTPDMPLPGGVEDPRFYGLFTYTIFSRLEANPNMTYRQLGQAVLQQYSAMRRVAPTPLFEGDLDAPVFSSESGERIPQWPLDAKAGSIPAGRLHGVTPGSKLAILPSPTSTVDDAVAYVEVAAAKNQSSTVAPAAYRGKAAVALADLPANAYARLTDVAIDFRLKVARPSASGAAAREKAVVDATLDRLAAATDKRFQIELVAPDAAADVQLAVMPENGGAPGAATMAGAARQALFFLPSSGDFSTEPGRLPPRVEIDAGDSSRLEAGMRANLEKIFRATSLSRLAAASDYRPDQVSVEFRIKPKDSDQMIPLVASEVPIVRPGDEMHIVAQNRSNKIVDINILYVGSDYAITRFKAERLVPGAEFEDGLFGISDTTFGMESMIAVLSEATPQSEMQDLKFLEQGGVPIATRTTAGAGDLQSVLVDIGLAPSTRSAVRLSSKDGPKSGVMVYPLETRPRS